MRKFIVALASLYVACTITMLGLLSNWFRYGLSLEATLVAAVTIGGGLVVLTVTGVAFKQPRLGAILALCAAVLAFVFGTIATHRGAFGTWLPPFQLHHVESSGYAMLTAGDRVLNYGVELRDPFSSAHEEYLVINGRGQERRIRLPIFDQIPAGYTSATRPQDWVVLMPTDNENIFVAEIGSFLSEKRFRVDLTTGRITNFAEDAMASRQQSATRSPQ